MMKNNNNNKESALIAKYIYKWLNEYIPSISPKSEHTKRAYEVTLSLYAKFLEEIKRISPDKISVECFSRIFIEDWIKWMKDTRGNSNETCNNRLASLKSFIKYLGSREVTMKFLIVEARDIPRLKNMRKKVHGLSKNGTKVLMSIPDLGTPYGRRCLTLISFLYGTAARISEVLSIKVNQLHLQSGRASVTIIGKGNKIRTLYLQSRVVSYLNRYLDEFHSGETNSNSYLFFSRSGGKNTKMTPEAVNKMLRKYAMQAHLVCKDVPLNLHCHNLRQYVEYYNMGSKEQKGLIFYDLLIKHSPYLYTQYLPA